MLLGEPQAMQPYPHVRICVAAKIQKKKLLLGLFIHLFKKIVWFDSIKSFVIDLPLSIPKG